MELFSTILMGAETAAWVWLTSMYLIKRKHRSRLFHAGLLAALVLYFLIYEIVTYYWAEQIWFITGVLELVALFTILTLNNEGCIWRNFCILVLTESAASMVISVGLMPFPYWEQELVKLTSFVPLSVRSALILILGFMPVSFGIASFVTHRIFPKEYEKDGRIYRVIVIGYIAISFISLGIRRHFTAMIRQGDFSDKAIIAMLVVWLVGCALLIYYVPYAYNRMERSYQKKEQQILAHMLAESSEHFERLIANNLTLGASGRLMIDAILASYKKRAEAENIRFDAVVQPLAEAPLQELDAACLLDDMLALCFAHIKPGADGAFVQIDVRYVNDCLFLETVYSGDHRPTVSPDEKMPEFLVKKYDGTRTVRRKNHEVSIGVLLPMNEGEYGEKGEEPQ